MAQRFDNQGTWLEARELFLTLADLEPDQRAEQLAALAAKDRELCAWVERLLGHDPGEDDSAPGSDGAESTQLGTFGPYQAVRLIAVGGMGEVYLAKRTDGEFDREVAIKCLRPGREWESLAERFLRERQVLARLDHEYIARLLDGGTNERDQPYLVLEYVQGEHIDVHCQRAGLGIRERVELFLKVLEAVQHSHDRGVIHRDLKPSNILIREDGQPRLLDFGISRPLEANDLETPALTGTGQRLFTPEYASPEQIRGAEITAASDVFSLGVILYGLLAEAGPWEGSGSLHDLERRVLGQDPLPPSRACQGTWRRTLSGDLDTIVLGCLEKSPTARHRSVQELSDELRRYLDGFPILTRPTRTPGRILRYAKRNPWQTLAAGALVLAGALGYLGWRHSRVAVDQREDLVAALSIRLEHAQNLASQDRYGDSALELLDVLEQIETLEDLEERTPMKVTALALLSRAYVRTNRPRECVATVERALALLDEPNGDNAMSYAGGLTAASTACRTMGDEEGALRYARQTHEIAQAWIEPGHPLRLESYEAYGGMSAPIMGLPERIAILAQGVEEARDARRPQDPALSSLLTLKGFLHTENGEYEEAIKCYEEALPIDRWNHGDGHGRVAIVRSCLGDCLRNMGHLDEAQIELEAALETFDARGHTDLAARALSHIGMVKASRGEFELAIEDLGEAKLAYAELRSSEDPICYHLEAMIADCLRELNRLDEARYSFEEALGAVNGVALQGPKVEADTRFSYALLLLEMGEPGPARGELQKTITIRKQLFGSEDPRSREAVDLLESLD